VIYKGAGGEFLLLANKQNIVAKNLIAKKDTIYITALNWTDMGPPLGTETFFFINSIKPLSKLTKLLNRYDKAPKKGQAKLALHIQGQLNSYDPAVQDDLSSLSSQLGKPVAGGVAFRGGNDSITEFSVTHECLGTSGIVFKKIVLIHQ